MLKEKVDFSVGAGGIHLMRRTPAAFIQYVDMLGSFDIGRTIRKEALSGALNGAWIYDTAEDWEAVEIDPAYGHTRTCLMTLDRLLHAADWPELSGNARNLVELGVGSGKKTLAFARTIGDMAGASGSAVLIDINQDLLGKAAFRVAALNTKSFEWKVAAFRTTFDNLLPLMNRHRRELRGSTVFSILGNTFANLPEDQTLDAIKRVMFSGDILVLSVEMASVNGAKNPIDNVLEHYRSSRAIYTLFSGPLKHLPGSSPIQIDAASGISRFSRMPKTYTVFAHTTYERQDVSVIHSNRYDQDELVNLLTEYGLQLLKITWRAESPFYRYFVFRRP